MIPVTPPCGPAKRLAVEDPSDEGRSGLIFGYATLDEATLERGVGLVARARHDLRADPGGAIVMNLACARAPLTDAGRPVMAVRRRPNTD